MIRLPTFGVAAPDFIPVRGVLPAILRIRFDDLSGPVVRHPLDNASAYVLVVVLGLY